MRPQAGMIGQPVGQAVGFTLGMCYPLHLGQGVAASSKGALFAAVDDLQPLAKMDLGRLAVQIESLLPHDL